MFEYVRQDMVGATTLGLFALWLLGNSISKKRSMKLFNISIVLLFIAINIYAPWSSEQDAVTNIADFQKGSVFTCTNAASKYRVSKKDNWEVDMNYFVKESLMIRADQCDKE